jgi:hypothetical protein
MQVNCTRELYSFRDLLGSILILETCTEEKQ